MLSYKTFDFKRFGEKEYTMKFKKWMILPAAYAVLETIAILKKGDSVYNNAPEEKNPLQGQMAKFIEDENEPENADGVRGHLISIGESIPEKSFYDKYVKRGIDKALSFAGLVVLAPVYAGISLAIVIDDPGPVLFTQKRVGKNKEYFKLHKFRSMKMCTPHDVPTHMLDNPEQYITRVGNVLRKLSLDELPQIWDIFIGNMAVIGPRPALWNQDVLIAERDKYNANCIRPGLTGWAQINGRDELPLDEKAKLDGVYASSESISFDAKCFIQTITSVLKSEGVVEGGRKMVRTPIKYSVLMSVYKNDSPEYLNLALKSIYEDQTRKPDEIVVVFDGPLTDELYQVLEAFRIGKENIVKFLPQETNKGLGEALRIGSEHCSGEYIFRMDADDISDPHRFAKQIAYIESHPSIDVLGTDIAEFNSSLDEDMRVRSCPADHDGIVKMGKRRNPMNHVSVCIRKAALLKSGGYQSLLLLEDYYLWLRMIVSGCKLANIKESLVYVRVGNGFNSKRGDKDRISGWLVLQKYMVDYGLIPKYQALLNMLYIWIFVNTPAWLKNDIYKLFLRK